MSKKGIEIPVTREKLYTAYITTLAPFIGSIDVEGKKSSNITKKEIEVLGQLYYYSYIYKDLPKEELEEFLFSTHIKKKVMTTLDITSNHLNTLLSAIRSRTYLGSPLLVNNVLNPLLKLDTLDSLEFIIKFKVYAQGTTTLTTSEDEGDSGETRNLSSENP